MLNLNPREKREARKITEKKNNTIVCLGFAHHIVSFQRVSQRGSLYSDTKNIIIHTQHLNYKRGRGEKDKTHR